MQVKRSFKPGIVLLTVLVFTCTNVRAQRKVIDVYLIAGQSNATGQGYTANMTDTMTIDKQVWLFHSGTPHLNSGLPPYTWQPLHPASESPDRFGVELSFGTAMKKMRPDVNIALIKHAHSATNLYEDWNPGKSNTDTLHQGVQYKAFIRTVTAGLDSLQKRGFDPVIKGMLWQQGESDADKGGTISSTYGQNLKRFIGRVRKQLRAKKMVFVYGYVYPTPNTGKGITEVRQAEHDVDQDSGTPLSVKKAFVVDTEGLSLRANDAHTRYPKDIIHFGTSGIWELGIRMAIRMNKQL